MSGFGCMDQPGAWRALNIWFKDVKLWRATTGWSQPKHSQKVSTSTANPTAWTGSFSNRQELCSHQWTVLSLWGTSLSCPHSLDVCVTGDLKPASPSEKPYLGARYWRTSASLGMDRGGKHSRAWWTGTVSSPSGTFSAGHHGVLPSAALHRASRAAQDTNEEHTELWVSPSMG